MMHTPEFAGLKKYPVYKFYTICGALRFEAQVIKKFNQNSKFQIPWLHAWTGGFGSSKMVVRTTHIFVLSSPSDLY